MSDNENHVSVSRSVGNDCGILPLVFSAISLCMLAGCGDESACQPGNPNRFRVSGPSMNPTLWDVSLRTPCPDCKIPIRIDTSLWKRALSTEDARCWHCGGELDLANAEFAKLPPDEVILTQTPIDKLLSGDLVLVRRSTDQLPGGLHVKRLLAIPGQTVSVDKQRRLLVDGQVPHFPKTPRVLVDSGRHRQEPRWHPIGNRWWRYEHRLVHRGNRLGPILDDYPGNISIDRLLAPVSSISVQTPKTANDQPNGSSAIEEVCLWSEPQQNALGLSSNNPIAVRLPNQSDPDTTISMIRSLSVYREVVYLADGPETQHFRGSYPITLAKDDFFVVGDNVPLSLDSRSWGPIRRKNVVGHIITGN